MDFQIPEYFYRQIITGEERYQELGDVLALSPSIERGRLVYLANQDASKTAAKTLILNQLDFKAKLSLPCFEQLSILHQLHELGFEIYIYHNDELQALKAWHWSLLNKLKPQTESFLINKAISRLGKIRDEVLIVDSPQLRQILSSHKLPIPLYAEDIFSLAFQSSPNYYPPKLVDLILSASAQSTHIIRVKQIDPKLCDALNRFPIAAKTDNQATSMNVNKAILQRYKNYYDFFCNTQINALQLHDLGVEECQTICSWLDFNSATLSDLTISFNKIAFDSIKIFPFSSLKKLT